MTMDEKGEIVEVPNVFWWTGFPFMDEVNSIIEAAANDEA